MKKLTSVPLYGIFLASVALCCIVLAFLCVFQPSSSDYRFGDPIADTSVIARFDAEFDSFLGAGHNLSEYNYIECEVRVSDDDLRVGQGPLLQFGACQIIVGKTGSIGVITYAVDEGSRTRLQSVPIPETEAYVVILEGCVAPESWWDHPIASGVVEGGRNTAQLFYIYKPWPEEVDFDNLPEKLTITDDSVWYWNGQAYVEAVMGAGSDSQVAV